MSYRKYTRTDLEEKLHLTYNSHYFDFNNVEMQPTELLQKQIRLFDPLMLVSEKARSEYIVAPVLLQLVNARKDKISLLSGVQMNVDAKIGLNGECDFLIVGAAYSVQVITPILGIVEAKDAALRNGYDQCAAQLYAARELNKKQKRKSPAILWGCVTNGQEWQFMKLVENQINIDLNVYSLNQLPAILGILFGIVDGLFEN